MNGVHDMGGMHGFGPVEAEPNEPVFHHDWERRLMAVQLAMGVWRRWNIDKSRYSRELMPPAEYLAASYYERWLWGLERLLIETKLISAEELASGQPREPGPTQPGPLRREGVAGALRNRRAARRDDVVKPRFTVGQTVRARTINPVGHTRLPRYVRGRMGTIHLDHGVFVFPDTNAVDGTEKPQHVYSVRFDAVELWGPDAPSRDSVFVDLWDDYLEPA